MYISILLTLQEAHHLQKLLSTDHQVLLQMFVVENVLKDDPHPTANALEMIAPLLIFFSFLTNTHQRSQHNLVDAVSLLDGSGYFGKEEADVFQNVQEEYYFFYGLSADRLQNLLHYLNDENVDLIIVQVLLDLRYLQDLAVVPNRFCFRILQPNSLKDIDQVASGY